jgi:hypothetical protein
MIPGIACEIQPFDIHCFGVYKQSIRISQTDFLLPSYIIINTTTKVSDPIPIQPHRLITDVSLADGWHKATKESAHRKSQEAKD